ncbi:ABATE domain-containing protein [Pseudoclavibacter sp. VKM Ac-2888]|uniref:CGNR zinc finger domain-containing protein n=1 Tax=Pseudoclavibacter sp. VKM Ac-2888 TaxID=2783830 RepID=UPI00188D7895|nr:CGNR zinc finger domain-containing protein [Pseudoclavibacter sp. VKM Ac-2888]
MADKTAFRTDGGAAWLNLLATRGQTFGAHPIERLRAPEDLQRWLTLMGLRPREAPSGGDLKEAVRLRETLRGLAMAAVEPSSPRELSMDALLEFSTKGNPALAGAPLGDVASALSALAIQATLTLRGPDRALLRQCDEVDCRWVFLDSSGRRRWCPAAACASRGRVRAHRAAAAASSVS